jgi:hypothetical protein
MIEEESQQARPSELPFARAYDYFKHMTGVSLISIGGVFALIGGPTKIERAKLLVILAAIGLTGVISLYQASALGTLESKPVPHAKLARQVRYSQFAAMLFLMVGLGAFVQSFTGALK